jgi:hypothetical protein
MQFGFELDNLNSAGAVFASTVHQFVKVDAVFKSIA